MKTNHLRLAGTEVLEIYDPVLYCRSGVCGVGTNPVLIQLSADIDWLTQQTTDKLQTMLLIAQLKLSNQYPSYKALAIDYGLTSINEMQSQKRNPVTVNHQAIVRLNKRKAI